MPATDPFDTLLISTAIITRRVAGSSTANYGQKTSATPTTVATGVKCRVCGLSGREWKYDKKAEVATAMVYLRVPTTWDLRIKDWIQVGNTKYNVTDVQNPSLLDHHLEATVETVVP